MASEFRRTTVHAKLHADRPPHAPIIAVSVNSPPHGREQLPQPCDEADPWRYRQHQHRQHWHRQHWRLS